LGGVEWEEWGEEHVMGLKGRDGLLWTWDKKLIGKRRTANNDSSAVGDDPSDFLGG
jgi:hypothetical protein